MSNSISFNRNFILVPTFLLAVLYAVSSCQKNKFQNGNSAESDTLAFSEEGQSISTITLENVWIKLGDSYGQVDVENVTESVESAEFSPDGKHIVSGAKKGWEVIMWETDTGNKVWENKLEDETEAVAFSPDGQYVAAGGEYKSVRIFNAIDGKEIKRLEVDASLDGMRFSHSGELLAAGDEYGLIHVWRTADWKKVYTLEQGEDEGRDQSATGRHADVNSIDFTEDDQFMASAGRNKVVKIWKVSDMSLLRTLEGHIGTVKTVRISPDGKLIAAGAGDASGTRIWDFETGEQLAHIPAAAMITEAVEFTPDGNFLFVGGNEGEGRIGEDVENPGFENNDGKAFIRVYDLSNIEEGEYEKVLQEPVFRQEYFHFTEEGKLMVSSHEDGTLRLWKVERG